MRKQRINKEQDILGGQGSTEVLVRTEGRAAYIKQEINKKVFLTGLFNRRSVFLFHPCLCCPGRTLHSYTGEHRAFPGSFVPGCLTKAGRKAQVTA